jgi:mxaD protein
MMNSRVLSFLTSTAIGFLLTVAGGGAHAADAEKALLHAEGKVELKSPPEKVWEVVGDFAGLHRWHPAVKGVTLLEGTNRVPMAVRELDLGDGQWLISELLDWDGNARRMRYRILKSALPLVNFVSAYTVEPTNSGGSVFTWKTEFRRRDADPKDGEGDATAVKIIQSVIDAGLANLPKVLKE